MSTDHVILNHLDAPSRILFWPISEFMTVVSPIVVLTIMGHPFIGFGIGGCLIWGIRFFKKSFGKGTLEGVLYWNLVHNKANYPVTPPSYIREYIG